MIRRKGGPESELMIHRPDLLAGAAEFVQTGHENDIREIFALISAKYNETFSLFTSDSKSSCDIYTTSVSLRETIMAIRVMDSKLNLSGNWNVG